MPSFAISFKSIFFHVVSALRNLYGSLIIQDWWRIYQTYKLLFVMIHMFLGLSSPHGLFRCKWVEKFVLKLILCLLYIMLNLLFIYFFKTFLVL